MERKVPLSFGEGEGGEAEQGTIEQGTEEQAPKGRIFNNQYSIFKYQVLPNKKRKIELSSLP